MKKLLLALATITAIATASSATAQVQLGNYRTMVTCNALRFLGQCAGSFSASADESTGKFGGTLQAQSYNTGGKGQFSTLATLQASAQYGGAAYPPKSITLTWTVTWNAVATGTASYGDSFGQVYGPGSNSATVSYKCTVAIYGTPKVQPDGTYYATYGPSTAGVVDGIGGYVPSNFPGPGSSVLAIFQSGAPTVTENR